MLQASVLARSMAALRAKARTGRLSVDADGSRTFVYFREGRPIFAEEGTQGETLGRLLVRQKLLSQEQYLHVLSKMSDALVSNEQIRFGETAVELGYLGEEEVRRALVDQVRWKVVRCFMREQPTWSFVDGESLVEEVPELSMALEGLFYAAAQWFEPEQRLESGLSRVLDRYLVVTPQELMPLAYALELDDAGITLLESFDGRRTARELCVADPSSPLHVEALLTTLAVLHQALFFERRVEARPPVAPVGAPVARPAAPSQAPIPAAIAPPIDRARVSQVLQKIAAPTPVQAPAKPQPEAHFRAPQSDKERNLLAEQAYQHGRKLLDRGHAEPALRHLKRAAELDPGHREYALVAEWCAVRDRVQTDGEAAGRLRIRVVELLKLDPSLAYGYYIAGHLRFAAEDYPSAKRFLGRALALQPTLTDAERYLRLCERRMSGGS